MWGDLYRGSPTLIGLRSAGTSSFEFAHLDGITRDMQLVSVRLRLSPWTGRTLLRFMTSNVLFDVWLGSPGRWLEFRVHTIRHCHIINDDSLRCVMQFQYTGRPSDHAGDDVPLFRFSYREREHSPLVLRGVYVGDEAANADVTILSYVQDLDRNLQLLYRADNAAEAMTDAVRRLEASNRAISIFASHRADEYTYTKIITIRPSTFVARHSLVPPHRLITYDPDRTFRTVAIPTQRLSLEEDISTGLDELVPEVLGRRPTIPSAEGWEW